MQTNGNKYPVQEITDDGHCLVLIDSNTYRIDDDAFDHALRPAPARIPDRPGLWEDKSDGLYTVWKNGQELWIMQIRESDGRWMNGPALLIGKTGEKRQRFNDKGSVLESSIPIPRWRTVKGEKKCKLSTNIFDQLRLSPPIPGPLHKRTVDAADLGTTAEVLAAAKALYRLVEGRRGRQILDFGQLPKRDQNRYINEAFKAFNDARKEMKCGSERKS